MKVVIVGDNLAAYAIAASFTDDAYDITLIGNNAIKLKHIEETLDIQTVHGAYTEVETFETAECHSCDILISITEVPEIDILATLIATNLYQVPLIITVVQGSLFHNKNQLFNREHILNQQVWISPSELVSDNIIQLIKHPDCREVVDINQTLCVARVQIEQTDQTTCQTWLRVLQNADSNTIVITVIRKGQHIAHCVHLQKYDHVIFACPKDQLQDLMKTLNHKASIQSIIIAGISAISHALVKKIHSQVNIKVIEKDLHRAADFAQRNNHITVLEGDINDADLLISEKIDQTDAFFALSDDDEDNLVAALQAKRHEVPMITSLVHRQEITPIIEENDIYSIEPQKMLIDSVFRTIHQPTVTQKHSLHKNTGEIICCKIPKHLHNQKLKKLQGTEGIKIFDWRRNNAPLPIAISEKLQYGDEVAIYLTNHKKVITLLDRLKPKGKSFFDFLSGNEPHTEEDNDTNK